MSFNGPHLGKAQSTTNIRNFTEEQKKAQKANGGATLLSMGSSKTMERSQVTDTKSINFGANQSGTGSAGSVPILSSGSAGTMARTEISTSNDITFGNKTAGGGGLSSDVSKFNQGSSNTMARSEVSTSNSNTFGADAAKEEAKKMARAQFDYDKQEAEELSLVAGSIYTIIDNTSDAEGWWIGIDSTGNKGCFPHNYVSMI